MFLKTKYMRKVLYFVKLKPEYITKLKSDKSSQLLQNLKTIGELHIDWYNLTNGAG